MLRLSLEMLTSSETAEESLFLVIGPRKLTVVRLALSQADSPNISTNIVQDSLEEAIVVSFNMSVKSSSITMESGILKVINR